jgi:membrane protease subunit HflC
MRAERKRIATRYRSEGEEMATKIRAEADRRKVEILSEAERTAEETRGRADAEATRIYAEAYGRDPEFYEFLRSLESYETSLREGTTIVLSAGADYLKWLHATGASLPAATDDSMLARPATVSPPAQTGDLT